MMAALFEIRAHLAIVVNLAVQDDGDCAVFVESWLVAGEQIDNRETSHTQRDAIIDEITFRVRAAMMHAIAHRTQQLFRAIRRLRTRIKVGPTGYSAHKIN